MIVRFIALHLLVASIAVAQAADVDSARTPRVDTTVPAGVFPNTWEIVVASGAIVPNVGLLGIASDTLVVTSAMPTTILLSDIELMRRRNGGHFWRGAAWGAGIMAPVGIVGLAWAGTEPPARRNGQRLIALGMWAGGALLGGIVGSFFPRTEEVELAILPVAEREETLRRIAAEDSTARSEALESERDRARRRAVSAAWKRKGK
jgi:hypothetical protein